MATATPYRHAKQASDYAYVATIDCGRGDVTVYSDEDLYAPLVDLEHHRMYLPIAWDVEVDGPTVLQDEKPHVPKGLKRFARTAATPTASRPAPSPCSAHSRAAQLTLKPSATSTTRSPGAPQLGQRSTVPAPR